MRLVNVHTFQLEEFGEGEIPPYAALSHRWTSEELNFKEVYKRRIDTKKLGYQKLVVACQKAIDHDLYYLWIDTCCINKESSAELSEAINSMNSWYKDCKVCLAYLQDVYAGAQFKSTFRGSVWFRRAWTLQELIAPQEVEFFDNNWTFIGTKESNAVIIEHITGIDGRVLKKLSPVWDYSIAVRMSWASERVATRREDIAYSLLGIFGIYMPPLYGEGSTAFFRLQQEIIRNTDDTTFLFWGRYNVVEEHEPRLLAHSPAEFVEAKNLKPTTFSPSIDIPMTVTNVGIEMLLDVVRWDFHIYGIIVAGDDGMSQFVVLVRKQSHSNAFYRVGVANLPAIGRPSLSTRRKLLVLWGREGQSISGLVVDCPKHGFVIETDARFPVGQVYIRRLSPNFIGFEDQHIADEAQRRVEVDFGSHMDLVVATMECKIGKKSSISLLLMFNFDSYPVACIYDGKERNRILQESASIVYSTLPTRTTGERGESNITVTTNRETGIRSRLLKGYGPKGNTFARIPRELLTNDGELWISFINPKSKANNSPGWWTFYISAHQKVGLSG